MQSSASALRSRPSSRTSQRRAVDRRPAPRGDAPRPAGERNPDLVGSHTELIDDFVRWPSRHDSGEPVLTWFGDGDTVLLGCTCGEWGWPFTAIVTVGPDIVRWSGYRPPGSGLRRSAGRRLRLRTVRECPGDGRLRLQAPTESGGRCRRAVPGPSQLTADGGYASGCRGCRWRHLP